MGDAKNRGSFFERVAQSQARAAEAAKKLDAERAAWNAEVTTIAERLGMQLGTSPLLITREKVPRPARVVLVGLDELLARVKFWTSGPLAAKPVTDALRAELEANVPFELAVPAVECVWSRQFGQTYWETSCGHEISIDKYTCKGSCPKCGHEIQPEYMTNFWEPEASVPSESAVPATPDLAPPAPLGAPLGDIVDPEFDPLTDCGPGDGFGCDDCEECPNGEEV